MDGCRPDCEKIVIKLHVNGGRAPVRRRERPSADSDGENVHLANYLGAALEHCDVCRPFDKDPHVPIAGMSAASISDRQMQVDLLFFGRLDRPVFDRCLFEVLRSNPRSPRKPSGGVGCVLQRMGRCLWAAKVSPGR